jgi:hypothetical protein
MYGVWDDEYGISVHMNANYKRKYIDFKGYQRDHDFFNGFEILRVKVGIIYRRCYL